MSTEREATPRPWVHILDEGTYEIQGNRPAEVIALVMKKHDPVEHDGEANAQLIVTAVNSFDTMRDALRKIAKLADDQDYCRCPRIRSLASSALAAIDGKDS